MTFDVLVVNQSIGSENRGGKNFNFDFDFNSGELGLTLVGVAAWYCYCFAIDYRESEE